MIKSGYLTYFSRGTFSKKWKEGFFKLFDSGTIQWYEDINDNKPVGVANLPTIKDYICIGENTRKVPSRSSLSATMSEQYLMCFPKNLARKENEVCWMFFKDQNEFNEWFSVINDLINPQQPPLASTNLKIYLPEAIDNNSYVYHCQQRHGYVDQPPPYPDVSAYPNQQQQYPGQYPRQQHYPGQYQPGQPQNIPPPRFLGQYNNNNEEIALAMLAGYHMGYQGFGSFGFGPGWGSFL
jgi:hypothetical protein